MARSRRGAVAATACSSQLLLRLLPALLLRHGLWAGASEAPAGEFLSARGSGEVVDPRRASSASTVTRYVAHLMPWFENTTRTEGSHWCDPDYGNSYYVSVLGRYGSADPAVIRKQLLMMKASGLDGVWIDLQFPEWLSAIRAIVKEVADLQMNFAVVVDNYAHPGIADMLKEDLQKFMDMPNYYKVYGRAVLPFYEHPERWGPTKLPSWRTLADHKPFVIGTYAVHPDNAPLKEGYDSLFFWSSPDIKWLEQYYRAPHFGLKVGAIYRGWREAYADRRQAAPYLGYLRETLALAKEHQPFFAQLVTWNDYSEGTMLEPSFLASGSRACADHTASMWHSETRSCASLSAGEIFTDGGQLPACDSEADPESPCSGSGRAPCASVVDCSKPLGATAGPGVAGCARGELSAYTDLATVARAVRGETAGDAAEVLAAIATRSAPEQPPSDRAASHQVTPPLPPALVVGAAWVMLLIGS